MNERVLEEKEIEKRLSVKKIGESEGNQGRVIVMHKKNEGNMNEVSSCVVKDLCERMLEMSRWIKKNSDS